MSRFAMTSILVFMAMNVVCADIAADITAPVSLIIDTDMSSDVDDVAALCITHALADRKETELLAVVHNTGLLEGVGAISVINHYYGRDHVPIGAFKGKFGSTIPGKSLLYSVTLTLTLIVNAV